MDALLESLMGVSDRLINKLIGRSLKWIGASCDESVGAYVMGCGYA